MTALRPDIDAAMKRMAFTLGTRSAIRHLADVLQPAENVREMTACFFAGGDGVLVLTDQRVIAVRDDFSRHKVSSVPLPAVTHLDYGPSVHDGFCAYWATGKLAVRRMPPVDIARLVEHLLTTAPQVQVFVSSPGGRMPTVPAPTPPPTPPVTAAATPSSPAAVGASLGAALGAAVAPVVLPTPEPAPAVVDAPDPLVESVNTQQDVLYGVLADLHAKGILSSSELADKMSLVAAMG